MSIEKTAWIPLDGALGAIARAVAAMLVGGSAVAAFATLESIRWSWVAAASMLILLGTPTLVQGLLVGHRQDKLSVWPELIGGAISLGGTAPVVLQPAWPGLRGFEWLLLALAFTLQQVLFRFLGADVRSAEG